MNGHVIYLIVKFKYLGGTLTTKVAEELELTELVVKLDDVMVYKTGHKEEVVRLLLDSLFQ